MPLRSALAIIAALVAVLALAPAASAKVGRDFVGITAEDVFAGDANYRGQNLQAQSSLAPGARRLRDARH